MLCVVVALSVRKGRPGNLLSGFWILACFLQRRVGRGSEAPVA